MLAFILSCAPVALLCGADLESRRCRDLTNHQLRKLVKCTGSAYGVGHECGACQVVWELIRQACRLCLRRCVTKQSTPRRISDSQSRLEQSVLGIKNPYCGWIVEDTTRYSATAGANLANKLGATGKRLPFLKASLDPVVPRFSLCGNADSFWFSLLSELSIQSSVNLGSPNRDGPANWTSLSIDR